LESLIRNYKNLQLDQNYVDLILNWNDNINKQIKFVPSRVIIQDFSSIPALIDFANIRNVVQNQGRSIDQVNPACLTDLILDHALADGAKKIILPKGPNGSDLTVETGYIECPIHKLRTECAELIERNRVLEFDRCKERLSLLKWSSKSFKNVLVVPPFNDISHQTNIECLARIILNNNGLLYPESVIGTDSHTCLCNAFGILSFNSCAIQCENVLLGKSIDLNIPEVSGYKIKGNLSSHVNSIDVILAITKHLRSLSLKNTIVEFTGNSVSELSISERETICNICTDYGALIGYFPMDNACIEYFKRTGRSEFNIKCIEEYFKKSGLFKNEKYSIKYSYEIEFDLSVVKSLCSGPKKVADKFEFENLANHFKSYLLKSGSEGGFGLRELDASRKSLFNYKQEKYELSHGSVLIASIASYTNSSNPAVVLGAAVLAKKAFEFGLKIRPYIKRTCFPGSGLLTKNYLVKSGLLKYLEYLG
jgi:aconitase A